MKVIVLRSMNPLSSNKRQRSLATATAGCYSTGALSPSVRFAVSFSRRQRLGEIRLEAQPVEYGDLKKIACSAGDLFTNVQSQLEQAARFAFRSGMHGDLDQSGSGSVGRPLLAVNPQQPNQWDHAVSPEGRNQ